MSPQATTKRSWLIYFGGIQCTAAAYGWLTILVVHAPSAAPLASGIKLVFMGLAFGTLVASALIFRLRTDVIATPGSGPLPTPQKFQQVTVISLALAEAAPILGLVMFFLGASREDFIPFAVAFWAISFLGFLPRGLAYWKLVDQQRPPT